MKFLVMCQGNGSGAYCVSFDTYLVNAKDAEAAKQFVLERYVKHAPYNIQVVEVKSSRKVGIVAEISDEWCE